MLLFWSETQTILFDYFFEKKMRKLKDPKVEKLFQKVRYYVKLTLYIFAD